MTKYIFSLFTFRTSALGKSTFTFRTIWCLGDVYAETQQILKGSQMFKLHCSTLRCKAHSVHVSVHFSPWTQFRSLSLKLRIPLLHPISHLMTFRKMWCFAEYLRVPASEACWNFGAITRDWNGGNSESLVSLRQSPKPINHNVAFLSETKASHSRFSI